MNCFKLIKKVTNRHLTASETEFLPAVIEVIEKPPSPTGRLIIYSIMGLAIGALIWAFVGEIDEVAVAPGKVIPVGHVSVIQAEDKGIIRNIYVRDGQEVKKGQVLIEMDPLFSEADFAKNKKEYNFYNLEIERLTAEKEGRPFLPSRDLDINANDVSVQLQLYESRNREYLTKLAAAESMVRQNEANLHIARINEQKYAEQLAIAIERETRIERLISENAVAYFQLLEYRGKRMELQRGYAAQQAETDRYEAALMQSKNNLEQVIAEHDRDITTKLIEAKKQLAIISEELRKTGEKNRLTAVISPIDGSVSQLNVHTVGGIVTPAQVLMNVVPTDVPLLAEVWIANKDIGFVHMGQSAEIKVETYNFQKFGTIPAEIIQISSDAEQDKDKNFAYRAELSINQKVVTVNGENFYISPGMSISAEIKTQKKRIIDFFLEPFKKYRNEALRER